MGLQPGTNAINAINAVKAINGGLLFTAQTNNCRRSLKI